MKLTKNLTKKQVVEMCREVFREMPEMFRGDIPAKREYFNDLTDSLAKDNQITRYQCDNWSNPF